MHFNCVGAVLHIMPSFSPSWMLKPSKFSPICPVWCNGQKDVQSAQMTGAFWVRNYSFCYHMSTLLTKGFWHLVLSRMLAQKLKQVGSSQTSHWITLSRDNLKILTVLYYEGWPILYCFCYIIYLGWLILRKALYDAPQFIFMQILS